MNKDSGTRWKLGMFVMIGLVLLVTTIYLVGKQKNLFGSTFHLKSEFKTVSGLKVGNNIRFSGINIGTVDQIELITDTSVMVGFVIRKKYQRFIKTDARASIATDGLMGDKVLTIFPGNDTNNVNFKAVKNNDLIASKNAIEMSDVMNTMKTSVDNAAIITTQLAEFSSKMNNGNGALSKLISDKEFASSLKNTFSNLEASSNDFAGFTYKLNYGTLGVALDSTMSNIQSATKGLSENMEAAQHNFLLKGFFNKKKKAEAKKQADLKKMIDIKKKKEAKDSIDKIKVEVIAADKITEN